MQNSKKQIRMEDVKEDVPEMRSVMLQPRIPTAFPAASEGLPHRPMPFGKPLREVVKQSPFGMPKDLRFGDESFSINDVKRSFRKNDLTWNVGKVVMVPSFHVLARTHCFVSNTTPEVIASRVSSFFKAESIAAEYDADRARAQAETICHIGFDVQLFYQRTALGEGGDIVVEVQRTKGCCFKFCDIAKMVMNAAKGIADGSKPSTNPRSASSVGKPLLPPPMPLSGSSFSTPPPMPSMVPLSSSFSMLPLPSIPTETINNEGDVKESVAEDLKFALDMLRSDGFDMNLIAMETLVQITSANSTCSKCRLSAAAQGIISGPIFDFLVSNILCYDKVGVHCKEGPVKCDHMNKMHRNALIVFANCLEAIGDTTGIVAGDRENIFCEELLAALITIISDSMMRPHEACHATRCLRVLINACEGALKKATMDAEVNNALLNACREGVASSHHSMLERESVQLEKVLMMRAI